MLGCRVEIDLDQLLATVDQNQTFISPSFRIVYLHYSLQNRGSILYL